MDASLVIRVIATGMNAELQSVLKEWEQQRVRYIAPNLLGYELANSLHRHGGYPPGSRILDAVVEVWQAMGIESIDYPSLHLEAMELARKFGHPASYDAHYLAVARRLGVDFFTCDRRLANSVQNEFDWVHYVNPALDSNMS